MDRTDRMTIDLLNHYAFVLHENVADLTDEEIEVAKKYAESYLEKNSFWKSYDNDFKMFVNKQKFNAITNKDYDSIEKLIYQVVRDINDVVDIDDWEFDIYYSVDYENKMLLSRLNKNDYCEKIDLVYDIVDRSFSPFETSITDDMDKLGSINYNSYSFYELYNVRI